MDQAKIGRFLADLRKEKSLTQEQIAEKIGMKIHLLKTVGRVPICTLALQGEGNLQQMLMDEGVYALSGCDFEGLDERFVRICVPTLKSLSRLTGALERLEKTWQ